MKKVFITIYVVFILAVSIVYGFVQTVKTQKAEANALAQKELADRNAAEARRQAQIAEEGRREYEMKVIQLRDSIKLLRKQKR